MSNPLNQALEPMELTQAEWEELQQQLAHPTALPTIPIRGVPHITQAKARAALIAVLTARAGADVIERDGWEACQFCEWDPYMVPKELGHKPDCPVTRARALLPESEAQ
jgi:hypothetical protein